jgi:bifunctional oligoribonuclease and PAP phosphatase NrnA
VQAPEPPAAREAVLRPIAERLLAARRVVLTTHVNADGDGAGSEAAVAAWLEEAGVKATIVNPTPFPAALRFLPHREGVVADLESPEGDAALAASDLVLVLDTSEPNRVAPLADRIDPARTIVIDHHPAGPSVVGTTAVQDPTAAATGELVYDLVRSSRPLWSPPVVEGIYVALVSDTGSFRFSNTSPRAHLIAAEMIARGVEPEAVYQRLFATFPRRRLELLREALATLEVDAEAGISWMVLPRQVDERLSTTTEDYEGLIDHARSVEGTRVAILFRETPEGETKISFRSNGLADVNRVARAFGGGGHVKAAGALVEARPEETVPRVLEAVRREIGG